MMKILTASQMKRLDQWAIKEAGIPALCLMENAGRVVALETVKALKRVKGRRVCVVCGAGNNGGDGFVAARHLLNHGAAVAVLFAGGTSKLGPEARVNFRALQRLNIPIRVFDARGRRELAKADVIIDALFGIGLSREITGILREIIDAVNASSAHVLAVDIPSGLDATTGKIWGACVKADTTVTLACPKKGLFAGHGPECSGKIVVADIGIPYAASFQ